MIQIIKLKEGTILISQIQEVTPREYGGPNTALINPYILPQNTRWMEDFTDETAFMILDTDILTMADPTESLLFRYKKVNGIVDKVDYVEEQDEEEEHY